MGLRKWSMYSMYGGLRAYALTKEMVILLSSDAVIPNLSSSTFYSYQLTAISSLVCWDNASLSLALDLGAALLLSSSSTISWDFCDTGAPLIEQGHAANCKLRTASVD